MWLVADAVMLATGRPRQGDQEFEGSLGDIERPGFKKQVLVCERETETHTKTRGGRDEGEGERGNVGGHLVFFKHFCFPILGTQLRTEV